MPTRYPPEFRHRVLELVKAGTSVAEVARDLGVSSTDNADLVAARRRIAELEAELAVTRRANESLREAAPPHGGSRRSQ
jgi:transposase